MSVGLLAKNTCEIISGGYDGEWHGADGGYENWTSVNDSGSVVSTYYYHDSIGGTNWWSSRVEVTLTDEWSLVRVNADNSIVIRTRTILNSIVRKKGEGTPSGYRFVVRVKQQASDVNWLIGPLIQDIGDYPSTMFQGPFVIGSQEFTIPPDGGESSRGTIYYRNNTEGHDSDTPPSQFIDEFWMGIRFRNTLPAKLPAPTVTNIVQFPDICERTVTTAITATMSGLPAGANTLEMYLGRDSQYRDAIRYTATSTNNTFVFSGLEMKPSTKYYYKIRLVPNRYISDWTEGTIQTINVIKPNVVAPAFSSADCARLTTNQRVLEWPNW